MSGSEVLVVGGGSCGAILAARLSEDPDRQVVLLEAGPTAEAPGPLHTLPIGPGSAQAMMHEAQLYDGQPHDRHGAAVEATLVRGRGLGGSSAVNGGYFVRATPADLDSWGSDLWSYERVLPFFRRAETDHDFAGPVHGDAGPIPIRRVPCEQWHPVSEAFAQAALDAGLPWEADKNAGGAAGIGPVPLNMDAQGRRVDTATAYLAGLTGSPDVTGRPDVTARLNLTARPNLTIHTDVDVRRVLLAGGRAVGVEAVTHAGIETFHADRVVLCAGGIGSALIMLRSNLMAGQGFSDHPEIAVPYAPAIGGQRGRALLEVTLNLEGLELRPYTASFADAVPGNPPMRPHIGVALMTPRSRGVITLGDGGAARIEHRYLRDPADRAAAARGVDLARELIRASGIGAPLEPVLGTSQHLSGSCAMGQVVDERLRVRGVVNLWIADTSVFPRIPSRGVHASAVMLAERAADLLR